jgi:excisionase family DNA binding protein
MDPTASLPDYLTDAQIAGWLAVSTAKVRRWAKRGLIPALSLPDGEYLFDPEALAEWVKTLPRTNQVGTAPEVAHA